MAGFFDCFALSTASHSLSPSGGYHVFLLSPLYFFYPKKHAPAPFVQLTCYDFIWPPCHVSKRHWSMWPVFCDFISLALSFASDNFFHMTSNYDEPKMKVSRFFDMNPTALFASLFDIVYSDSPFGRLTSPKAHFLDFQSCFYLSCDLQFNVPPGDRTTSDWLMHWR